MAQTGSFITPRLWGRPWLEKPPLLYWMVAAASTLGLGPELASRLPVALLSLAFLAISFSLLRLEFGASAAATSVSLLATCAGWLTYSDLCLTDLPLAVFFSLAVFLSLALLREQTIRHHSSWRLTGIGASLGAATLAKGLVPVALAIPLLWFLRRYWRQWWMAISAFLLVALPWYILVYLQNGNTFLEEFFWKHHLQRLYSASLQHVQPWYYYLPILVFGLFPWTPLLGLLATHTRNWDIRRCFLASIFCFGFFFFSISLNKLPGYLLPLLPSLFALIGAQLEFQRFPMISRGWLLPCAILISSVPLLAHSLPQSLALGRFSAAPIGKITGTEIFYLCVPLLVLFLSQRARTLGLLVLCATAAGLYLKATTFPILDREVSARGLWRQIANISSEVCENGINRDWIYGLSFYRGSLLPHCGSNPTAVLLPNQDHPPTLMLIKRP
jgi:4-amino-4-deoxy-L-arabinose transferase-like glycosyltransferase